MFVLVVPRLAALPVGEIVGRAADGLSQLQKFEDEKVKHGQTDKNTITVSLIPEALILDEPALCPDRMSQQRLVPCAAAAAALN